jgi:hypothetical protein
MTNRITEKWNDKEMWFRDHAQASRVGEIILERLADDLVQEECRYLSRLRWHLFMGYQEVSYDELQLHVSQTKMAILDNLFALIVDSDYDGIDQWTVQCEQTLPIIVDKWREQNSDLGEDEGLVH